MGDPKYVVIESKNHSPAMYIFPDFINLKNFVLSIGCSDDIVSSAGMIANGQCYGVSELMAPSKPERDNKLLQTMLFEEIPC